MKLNDGTLSKLLSLADQEEKVEFNDTLKKQWIKSIDRLDKSIPTGYSLIGDFIATDEELEPGLYLILQEFDRSHLIQKSFAKWEGVGLNRKLAKENENIVFENREVEEIDLIRRGILFDVSNQACLIYCRFLPQKWAKRLWKPIETWLEQQPNIEEKIAFWKQEVTSREAALEKAKERLAALKNQHSGVNKELTPEISQWLRTAAVLGGNKKAIGERSL